MQGLFMYRIPLILQYMGGVFQISLWVKLYTHITTLVFGIVNNTNVFDAYSSCRKQRSDCSEGAGLVGDINEEMIVYLDGAASSYGEGVAVFSGSVEKMVDIFAAMLF